MASWLVVVSQKLKLKCVHAHNFMIVCLSVIRPCVLCVCVCVCVCVSEMSICGLICCEDVHQALSIEAGIKFIVARSILKNALLSLYLYIYISTIYNNRTIFIFISLYVYLKTKKISTCASDVFS
jgi:hypothetical protein